MGTAFVNRLGDGTLADDIVAIAGRNNVYQTESNVVLGEDSKVVGGNSIEMAVGSSLVQAGADYLSENSVKAAGDFVSGYKIGDNSSLYLAQMDQNVAGVLKSSFDGTQSLLDQAMTLVGLNSNNFMALAAGRDPDNPLADQSNEVLAEGKADVLKAWLKTTKGKLAIAAVISGLVWKFYWKKGRK